MCVSMYVHIQVYQQNHKIYWLEGQQTSFQSTDHPSATEYSDFVFVRPMAATFQIISFQSQSFKSAT